MFTTNLTVPHRYIKDLRILCENIVDASFASLRFILVVAEGVFLKSTISPPQRAGMLLVLARSLTRTRINKHGKYELLDCLVFTLENRKRKEKMVSLIACSS